MMYSTIFNKDYYLTFEEREKQKSQKKHKETCLKNRRKRKSKK